MDRAKELTKKLETAKTELEWRKIMTRKAKRMLAQCSKGTDDDSAEASVLWADAVDHCQTEETEAQQRADLYAGIIQRKINSFFEKE